MTLSITGRCALTNRFGIAIASSPMTVASRCAFIQPGVGAVATQAATNPALGPLGLKLLSLGFSPEKVIAELRASDPLIEMRQVGVIDRHGRSAAFTGEENGDYKGQICGQNVVAVGNGLGGPDVVSGMATAFEALEGQSLEERLMRGLEAGCRAGGDREGHWSAGILVYGHNVYPRVDLRVDMHLAQPGGTRDAVEELRRIFDAYAPMIDYYEDRPLRFRELGEWNEWLSSNNPSHFTIINALRPSHGRS